ncbi:MAG: hypothetical protein BroJett038_30420 [Chloroflexota bacterium]|nr:MAG: hypothetical protein BroJett038_30420 [Chloroflexota bacterium]
MAAESRHYENPDLWTEDRFASSREQQRLSITAGFIPNEARSLLDVGTGNGAFLALLEARQTPLSLMGLERSQAAIEAAVCQAEIRAGSLDALPWQDRAFDVVSALEVIEHLPYGLYERSLREIERVAGGYILVSVPYREKRRFTPCPYCGCRFHVNYHMRSFDERSLAAIFQDFDLTRFQIVYIDDYITAPVLRTAYRILGKNRQFPTSAVCPQCGFSGSSPENTTLSGALARARAGLRDKIKNRLPTYKRAQWIVALYRRKNAS